jgi:hypothetical protein
MTNPKTNDLDDDLSELFGGTAEPREKRQVVLPASYQPPTFDEACPKCRGTGQFRSYSGRSLGQCFACKGRGKNTFKTSHETRAKNRETAAVRREKLNEAKAEASRTWCEEHKDEVTWLRATATREETKMGLPPFKFWEFPIKLCEALNKFGSLTDGQLAAVRKCIARDAVRAEERAAQKVEREAAAPVADTAGVDRLKAAFDQAIAYTAQKGLKLSPRITIGGMTLSPAKANSANPGALYVKAGQTYLGKIAGGRFLASRDCTDEQQAQVLAFVANPAEAAKVYGQTTGTCCVCNATLRSEWKHRGIGPICAEKFGW